MTNIKTVDITPDTSLLPKLGYAGYSPAQAIAELVDNSIDEILEDRELQVAIKIDGESIIVADNAKGMDEKEIILAMTLAHSEKMGKLGEFGLGLKTACLSLGEVFTIKTKHYSASKEYAITFDEAEWKCAGAGWTLQLQEHDSPGKNHYTIIRITRLKKFY
jgi:HSP90 family molecular chaperone